MSFVCVLQAVYVCAFTGQSKTCSIAEALETVLRQMQVSAPAVSVSLENKLSYRFPILKLPPPAGAVPLV